MKWPLIEPHAFATVNRSRVTSVHSLYLTSFGYPLFLRSAMRRRFIPIKLFSICSWRGTTFYPYGILRNNLLDQSAYAKRNGSITFFIYVKRNTAVCIRSVVFLTTAFLSQLLFSSSHWTVPPFCFLDYIVTYILAKINWQNTRRKSALFG